MFACGLGININDKLGPFQHYLAWPQTRVPDGFDGTQLNEYKRVECEWPHVLLD